MRVIVGREEIVQPVRWILQGAKSVHFRLAKVGSIALDQPTS